MKSLRLNTIASFIEPLDSVADIGCDHAYLTIFLVKNKLVKKAIASDINQNALNIAINNIKKENLTNEIPIVLSDGLENINQDTIDTLVLSGMGTSTILKILKKVEKNKIKKIIIQSNNNLYNLRKLITKLGFYLHEEKVIYEKNHYYVIGKYLQDKKKLNKQELHFGLYNKDNQSYYNYINTELNKINQKITFKHFKEKIKIIREINLLKKYL